MTDAGRAHRRLHNQRIAAPSFAQPQDVVAWLGAVQAQDYGAAKWAVGLRMQTATDAQVDRAFAEGAILRTHLMRPTWHFVTPTDIRWILALTAPRVHAFNAYWYRKLELDSPTFLTAETALARALDGGRHLTRPELLAVLERAGIATLGPRFPFLIMHAELEGLVCSGGRREKQFTYALLDERVSPTPALAPDEALAALARRYFTSHGPATLEDFVWWSGLTVADARAGLAMAGSLLVQEVADGRTYWFSPDDPPPHDRPGAVYLLPNFDEYVVGYTDRSAVVGVDAAVKLDPRGNILFSHSVVLDGRIAGSWKRTLKKGAVSLDATLLAPLGEPTAAEFSAAVARYGRFLDMPITATTQVW